jgi:hypothetical protein
LLMEKPSDCTKRNIRWWRILNLFCWFSSSICKQNAIFRYMQILVRYSSVDLRLV